MIRKDYIQRYFDELAKVLAAVLQLKNDLKPTEAEAKLNDFSTDFLGVNFEELLAINTDFIEFLIQEKEFTLTHFKILESVLYQKHLLFNADEKLKALTLIVLVYTSENDSDYSLERATRLNELSN